MNLHLANGGALPALPSNASNGSALEAFLDRRALPLPALPHPFRGGSVEAHRVGVGSADLKPFRNGEPKMISRRDLTYLFELARAKLRAGHATVAATHTRQGVIRLIEKLNGTCEPGKEIEFLNAYLFRGGEKATPPDPLIRFKGDYKLPLVMRIAQRKAADHPVPLSMNTTRGGRP